MNYYFSLILVITVFCIEIFASKEKPLVTDVHTHVSRSPYMSGFKNLKELQDFMSTGDIDRVFSIERRLQSS